MTLGEIRSLLSFRDVPEKSCITANNLLDKHIEHVLPHTAENVTGLSLGLNAKLLH